MSQKPVRICTQKLNQVICVLCTFHNIMQKKIFHKTCDFLKTYEHLCRENSIKIQDGYYDKKGISDEVLKTIFITHGYHTVKKSIKTRNIDRGWAVFQLKKNGFAFLHAVGIVRGWVIDSIVLSNNKNGVYKWDGHLIGYDSERLTKLFALE